MVLYRVFVINLSTGEKVQTKEVSKPTIAGFIALEQWCLELAYSILLSLLYFRIPSVPARYLQVFVFT